MALPRTPSFRLDGRRALVTGAGRGVIRRGGEHVEAVIIVHRIDMDDHARSEAAPGQPVDQRTPAGRLAQLANCRQPAGAAHCRGLQHAAIL